MKAFRLEGSSMLPVFRPGQAVTVSPERPRPGDCVVYSYLGRVLLHRVTAVSETGATLADDAGRLEPHLVPWGDVQGRVLSGHPLAAGAPGLIYSRTRRLFSRLFLKCQPLP